MVRFFDRILGCIRRNPTLDDLRIDTAVYTPLNSPEPRSIRAWQSPEGDGVGIYLFLKQPDSPATARSIEEFATMWRGMLVNVGGNLTELRIIDVAGGPAIHMIASAPQSPSGRTYLGSITLPFRDFSFVVKCQCLERGVTGVKAAVLLQRHFDKGGTIQTSGEGPRVPGFDSDLPEFDAEFPSDPVARARRLLAHLAQTLTIAPTVRALPGFSLPKG